MTVRPRGSWSLLLATLALTAGCLPAPRHGERQTTPATLEEPADEETDSAALPAELIRELVAETGEIRELGQREPFEAVTVTADEVRDFIRGELAATEMEQAELIMEAFGFIPEELDLAEQMEELLSEEVVGMYDPRTTRLMVLRSMAEGLDAPTQQAVMARMVLIHEVTHALQDQHFETLERAGEGAWSDDAESVSSCLAEGDATLTMLLATMRRAGAPVDPTVLPGFRAELRRSGEAGLPGSEALSAAPPYFGHVMAAMYLEGAAFAAELRAVGGWAAVDEAHRNPPLATRDILHTERYLAGRRVIELDLPDELPMLTRAGYRRLVEATLGELESGAFLLPLEDLPRLRAAADGWAGDRFSLWVTEDGPPALIWRVRFEDEGEAAEFFSAAVETVVAAGRGPCESLTPSSAQQQQQIGGTRRCHGGRDVIEQQGADVVLLRNLPPEVVGALAPTIFGVPRVERAAPGSHPELLERWRERYGAADAPAENRP